MKIFRWVGIAACVILIISAFLPWVKIELIQQTYSGITTGSSNFGKPGYLNIFFAVITGLFLFINRVWSQRANVFLGALLVAWSIRNYILFTHCEMGYCPAKKIGLWLTIFCSLLIFITILLASPKDYKSNINNEIMK